MQPFFSVSFIFDFISIKYSFKFSDDADVKIKLKLEPYEKNGEIYTKIAKIKLLFSVKKFNVKLDNLFNGKQNF